ncbi:hypothetical protein NC652_006813 [Populus alba x Populus x berolinensis]|nr:hypothetical protein NC651_006584 [Populus alba x Populus x berolinensis]KAJ6955509.1 hypothetical protein NC652_006813 [Populus alba x Populus x berolinensis]
MRIKKVNQIKRVVGHLGLMLRQESLLQL